MKTQLEKIEDELKKDSTESVFQSLYNLDISPYVNQMPGYGGKEIDYIEWSTAWRVVRTYYPDTTYKIHEFPLGSATIPYLSTPQGFFVQVSVTIQGRTETDFYALDGKEPSASDISDAHQRALVKALGRHGFGLKLWEKKEREKLHPKTNPPSFFTPPPTKTGPKAWNKEFLFTFGKHKGKGFNDIGFEDLESYIRYLKKPDPAKTIEENQKNYNYNKVIFEAYDTWKAGMKAIGASPKNEEPPPPNDNDFPDLPF